MSRKPMAQNPLVAMAERAAQYGIQHAAIAVLGDDGCVRLYETPDCPRVLLVGILSMGHAMALEDDPPEG